MAPELPFLGAEDGEAEPTPATREGAIVPPNQAESDSSGRNFQPTSSSLPHRLPNDEYDPPVIYAIGYPASLPKTEAEKERLEKLYEELRNAPQGIFPTAEDEEKTEGPPHRDPTGLVDDYHHLPLRKIGLTKTGWELWVEKGSPTGRMYYYNRAKNVTKYYWTAAEIEAEEGEAVLPTSAADDAAQKEVAEEDSDFIDPLAIRKADDH